MENPCDQVFIKQQRDNRKAYAKVGISRRLIWVSHWYGLGLSKASTLFEADGHFHIPATGIVLDHPPCVAGRLVRLIGELAPRFVFFAWTGHHQLKELFVLPVKDRHGEEAGLALAAPADIPQHALIP
jgi:hypothetical protein